jgi:hypothetical protein
MATAKQLQNTSADLGIDTPSIDTTSTDTPTTDAATSTLATALPEAQMPDFSTSDTWGQGGRYVINQQGQRVLASGN